MNAIALIPARWASTRLPGKPLADICGKPMIWWVHNRVSEVAEIAEVIVATDDERIVDACEVFGIKCTLTRDDHPDHISRIHEVSENIDADFYICVNGDEPLIDPVMIRRVIPLTSVSPNSPYFQGTFRTLASPAEAIDPNNIKLVLAHEGRCLYLSRTPIPHPQGNLAFNYLKYVGIECFNKAALDFFVSAPKGMLEATEDIDHLRFIENGVAISFIEVDSDSISVDTQKDLDFVRSVIGEDIEKEERTL